MFGVLNTEICRKWIQWSCLFYRVDQEATSSARSSSILSRCWSCNFSMITSSPSPFMILSMFENVAPMRCSVTRSYKPVREHGEEAYMIRTCGKLYVLTFSLRSAPLKTDLRVSRFFCACSVRWRSRSLARRMRKAFSLFCRMVCKENWWETGDARDADSVRPESPL